MFDQFKPIMQNGERYILVENGEPQYVLMTFGDYRELLSGRAQESGANPHRSFRSEWEGANAELSSSIEPVQEAIDPATVRLEDLPL